MTTTQMVTFIGRTVTVPVGSMDIECKVVDVKHVYGVTRLQVQPVSGTGMQWVDECRVGYAVQPGHRDWKDNVKAFLDWSKTPQVREDWEL